MLPSLDPIQVIVIIAYFILGYLFYSSMYAAIGATVSSEQDSQQAAVPITMFLVIGMVSMTAITGDPRGGTSAIMTLVPMWSPMLMPLRYILGGASPGRSRCRSASSSVSTFLVARAAAKIYRVGILMYGKRPGFGELLRWLGTSGVLKPGFRRPDWKSLTGAPYTFCNALPVGTRILSVRFARRWGRVGSAGRAVSATSSDAAGEHRTTAGDRLWRDAGWHPRRRPQRPSRRA